MRMNAHVPAGYASPKGYPPGTLDTGGQYGVHLASPLPPNYAPDVPEPAPKPKRKRKRKPRTRTTTKRTTTNRDTGSSQ